jgi:hypothetical protein
MHLSPAGHENLPGDITRFAELCDRLIGRGIPSTARMNLAAEIPSGTI